MADNSKIVSNLFYYLERHLFGADSDTGNELLNKGQFGVMMTPGQFLSPNWQETDGSADMYHQWNFLNESLDTSFTYKPQITTVSGQYWDALDRVSLRHRPLTATEKQELADIDAEIVVLQPRYDLYSRRFDDAALAYEFEGAKPNPSQGKLQQLLAAMNQARNNWESIGRKSYFENNLVGRSWQIQTGNPSGGWLKLRNDYQNATRIAPAPLGEYQATYLSPAISTWNNAGWATFTRTITETETHHYSKSVSWSAGMGARWGLFNHVDVGVNGEKTVVHDTSDVTSIDVTFDYLRCRIHRPWLKPDLFADKDWTWKQPKTFVYLSDGGNLAQNPPVRPLGNLPFLQTSIIAVKNVIIRADFSHTDQTEMYSRISGNVSAGFGCFSVRGTYSEVTHTVDVKASFDGTELRIPHPQVVGFLGILLPKSPDPNKNLPYWGSDAVFPDHMSLKDQKQLENARAYDASLNQVQREFYHASSQIDKASADEKDKVLKAIIRRHENAPHGSSARGKANTPQRKGPRSTRRGSSKR